MAPETDEHRHLGRGDIIEATPCVVTIRYVTTTTADGYFSTCDDRHTIDRSLYEAGHGPWRAAQSGRSGGPDE